MLIVLLCDLGGTIPQSHCKGSARRMQSRARSSYAEPQPSLVLAARLAAWLAKNFLFASTKLLNKMPFSKFYPSARVLMWTYVNLWVLTPGIWTFSLQNAPLFCIFVVRLINTIYQLCLLPIITIKTPINRRPSVAWSSPRIISLSFCLALPGKSSRDSYAKIQTSQASLSSVDERFFLQR